MALTRKWLEQQAQQLLAIGIDAKDAQRTIAWLIQRMPSSADAATWVPTELDLLDNVTDADVQDARADWYVTAPAQFKRILDAPEVD